MATTSSTPFFWLHLKKCGGTSFRAAFTPPYTQTDRQVPTPFVALPREEWNDNLNNYRVPLGKYDYRRMLFAKTFLFSDDAFNTMFKFAIVRNPYDRIVSAWKATLRRERFYVPLKGRFSRFLESLPETWDRKEDRRIATHTAPIWPDITDEKGNLLLDEVLRLEDLERAVNVIRERLELDIPYFPHKNKANHSDDYRKFYDKRSRRLVEELFGADIANLGYDF